MPMVADSIVRLTVPIEFNMEIAPITLTTTGVSLALSPRVSYETVTRTITIENFNTEYLQEGTILTFYISGLANPESTSVTHSFQIEFLDQNWLPIETISQGITFQAKVNTLS